MSNLDLLKAAYNLAGAADRAADSAVPEEVARIVKLHAKVAVVAAWIPIDGVDLLALAVNTWWMYVRINKALKLPFSQNVVKSLLAGFGTNIVMYLILVIISEALKLIPIFGSFAGAVIESFVFYAATLATGIAYMQALALILKKELPKVDLKAAANSLTKDKDALQQVLTKASGGSDQKELK
jgi:uncharacterized protein (DUF697 family)